MKKFLQKIFVLQIVSNKGKNPKLGRGFIKAYRLNPWNPLSYITCNGEDSCNIKKTRTTSG